MQTAAEPSYLDLKLSRLSRSRWQLVQTMVHQFWKRWTVEYLPDLQNRSKWKNEVTIAQGALVLLKETNCPTFQWPLGRIIQLHSGADGIIRVVTVKTAKGEYKRAVPELCVLPIDD